MKLVLSAIIGLFLLGCNSDVPTQEIKTENKTVAKSLVKEIPIIPNAGLLYSKCSVCHGINGEKIALGKSAIIAAWKVQRTIDALNGYKDGSYGGDMKNLMKAQVSKLSTEEIQLIAKYISTLKRH